jgi:hypothetical protein
MERPLNPRLHQKQQTLIEYYGSFGLLNKRDKSREMKKTPRIPGSTRQQPTQPEYHRPLVFLTKETSTGSGAKVEQIRLVFSR